LESRMPLLSALLALILSAVTPPVQVRATVWVRAGDRATGTGWVVDVDRRWVVTARHVVGDRDTVEVDFIDHPITDRRHYVADHADLRRRGLTAVGRVIRRHDNADLALLELDRLPAGVPALTLRRDRPDRATALRRSATGMTSTSSGPGPRGGSARLAACPTATSGPAGGSGPACRS